MKTDPRPVFLGTFRHRSHAVLLLPLVLAVMHVSWGIGFFSPVWIGDRIGTLAASH